MYEQANAQADEQADACANEQADNEPKKCNDEKIEKSQNLKSNIQADNKYFEQANEQADEQANASANACANEHNKLNKTKLFNYILNNKERSENFCDGNLTLSYDDRLCIVRILKKLDLYIENLNTVKLMTAKELLKYQECYYAISVLCTNSYKAYMNRLTREILLNKYLKVEEYCKNKNEDEKVRYLIKALQNAISKEGGILNGN